MPKMHLRQPGSTNSAYGLFIKNRERNQKFKETGDSQYIYQNKLDKACFHYDVTYEDFKNLPRRTDFVKVLRYKAFDIPKNMMDINVHVFASMVY